MSDLETTLAMLRGLKINPKKGPNFEDRKEQGLLDIPGIRGYRKVVGMIEGENRSDHVLHPALPSRIAKSASERGRRLPVSTKGIAIARRSKQTHRTSRYMSPLEKIATNECNQAMQRGQAWQLGLKNGRSL